MWAPIPWSLAAASLAFVAWYVVAFVWLWRIAPQAADEPESPLPWWRRMALLGVVAAGLWGIVHQTAAASVWQAYGIGLLVALAILLLAGNRRPQFALVPNDRFAIVVLAFGALLLRLAAPDVAPPGLAEDEAKAGMACVGVLERGWSVLRFTDLHHPQVWCLGVGPLIAFFGPGVLAVHLYPIIAGVLSIVAFYLLAAFFFAPAVAMAVSALLAAAPFHLLYSRTLFGTEITLLQILCLAFAIHAARRLSRFSAVMAGTALGLLLLHYVAVRSMVAVVLAAFLLAQVADRQGFRQRFALLALLVACTGALLAPLLASPEGRVFLRSPVQYGLFIASDTSSWSEAIARLLDLSRRHLQLFGENSAPYHSGSMAHSRIMILPPWLEALLVLGLADALVRPTAFARPFLACLFVAGLLPSVLSGAPNSHRSMMVLPAVYLLIGAALERLALLLPPWRSAGAIRVLVLAGLAVLGAGQGVLRYFGPMWSEPTDYAKFGGDTADVAREAARLSQRGPTYVAPVSIPVRFLAHDAGRGVRVRHYGFHAWLPENWAAGSHATVLGWSARLLIPWLDQTVPSFQSRLFTDPYGHIAAAWWVTSTEDLRMGHRATTAGSQCGGLMLAKPYRLRIAEGGSLRVGAVLVTDRPPEEQPWFAAGLHGACLEGSAHLELHPPTGKARTVHVRPQDLYDLPVHGWVHRAACRDTPDLIEYLAVEPLLFEGVLYRLAETWCPDQTIDTFAALIAPSAAAREFRLWRPLPLEIEITLAGKSLELLRVDGEYLVFVVPPSETALRLEVRLQQNPSAALYVLRHGAPELPPYEMFRPPLSEAVAPPQSVRWGRWAGGAQE